MAAAAQFTFVAFESFGADEDLDGFLEVFVIE